jgi:hypothetical protein
MRRGRAQALPPFFIELLIHSQKHHHIPIDLLLDLVYSLTQSNEKKGRFNVC